MPIAAILRLLIGLLTPRFDGKQNAAAAGRAAAAGVFVLLACLALFVAIGLAGAALWAYAAVSLGSAGASLVVAGAFAALALLLLLGAWLTMRAKQKPATRPLAGGVGPAGTDPAAAMLGALNNVFSQNKPALLLAALVAGLFAERMQKRD